MSSVPVITGGTLGTGPDPSRPLLVLGPSIGTSAATLWGACAAALSAEFHVVAWDLPGHGNSRPAQDSFSVAELAAGVLAVVDEVLVSRGTPGAQFDYAGDSFGGAVGLQLLVDHPGRIRRATLLCTGAKIGTAEGWFERAALVRAEGMAAIVAGSTTRWFAPGSIERRPDVAAALLAALRSTDAESYARGCEALADFDVRERLGDVTVPVLAVAGGCDVPTPVESLRTIAHGVADGRLVVLHDVGHLAPAEAPDRVVALITDHVHSHATVADVLAAGRAVRREVLGDAHVDRAEDSTTDLTRDFQELITQYAWGSIWTRPGLDRRSRSLITLTALVARGHHEELALHLRAARTNGLTNDEIKELLLQTAIYCGVPDANTAFRIAHVVLAELDAPATEDPT